MARVLLLSGFLCLQVLLCVSPPPPEGGGNCTAPDLTNGQVSSSGTSLNKVATFSCNSGFTLVGKDILKCVAGTWYGDTPMCIENDPSVREYFMEAVSWMNRTRWRYFLPEDTDVDLDGNISDLEVQDKFNTYMGEVFKLMDHDKDQSIVEEELRSLKLDIPHLTKAVDIALENFPLRPFFLAADGNGDGFYDENDFYIPEEILEIVGAHTYVAIGSSSEVYSDRYGYKKPVTKIGQTEGTVICKSLGYAGLERVIEAGELKLFDQSESPVFEQTESPVFEQTESPVFDQSESPVFEQSESPVFDQTESPVFDQTESPLYDQDDTPETGFLLDQDDTPSWALDDTPSAWALAIQVPPLAFSCDGTERNLEDCKEVVIEIENNHLGPVGQQSGMGIVCQETLRLVGGKDSSSGDIFVGNEGLVCIDWRHKRSTSEVVCRELGYSGVLGMTRESAFTGVQADKSIRKSFQCRGDEEKLDNCPFSDDDCLDSWVYGVVCAPEGKAGMSQELVDLIKWNDRRPEVAPYKIWEEYGRFLFIADYNGDGKLTLAEIATKGKELLTKILEFLDENQDGKISVEDIDLHLSLGPVQNLVSELFDDVTKGEGEFDLYDIKIVGQNMSKFFGNGLKNLDKNEDGKLNAADIFSRRREETEASFLIPLLSEKLDHNQDGKIQREELTQFLDEMFNQLDMDKDGALTLEDIYILLQDKGLNCLQVGAFRTFTKVFIGKIDAVARNFFSYIFHQFDIDRNGQISTTEMEQMHIPCDTSGRYGKDPRYYGQECGPYYYGNSCGPRKNVKDDPRAMYTCGYMLRYTYFGWKRQDWIPSFPQFVFSERRGRWRDGHYEAHKETLVDKLTQHACAMLT